MVVLPVSGGCIATTQVFGWLTTAEPPRTDGVWSSPKKSVVDASVPQGGGLESGRRPVYDDDELLLLVSKPNHGGGLRFNPIPQEANKDKDEEAYEDEKMKDVEREDEFYSLLWPLALDLLAALMEESFIG
ncbi:hypothetical protein GW17_00054059 [Ensete ventricosum]|nr:hypothetical protein GW17_00054059 [Ensete ventricosum]